MPHRLTAPDPVALLALVPELVGFVPHDSLVLVALCGDVSRGTFRVNLPTGDADPGLFAATLVGLVCRVPGADTILPIVYADAPAAHRAFAPLFSGLRRAASAAGFRVLDGLFVAADGWGGEGRQPRPAQELEEALRLRRLDPDAAPVAPAPHEEAALPRVERAQVVATAEAFARLRSEGEPPDPLWFARYSATWAPDEAGPVQAALAASMLSRPWARDVVLITWAWGSEAGLRALRFEERHRRGAPTADGSVVQAMSGSRVLGRPSATRIRHGIRLLRQVAARMPSPERAPALAALAWLSWALGRSSVAWAYVGQARASDPQHRFAELVEIMLDRGMLPEWAFDDPARVGR